MAPADRLIQEVTSVAKAPREIGRSNGERAPIPAQPPDLWVGTVEGIRDKGTRNEPLGNDGERQRRGTPIERVLRVSAAAMGGKFVILVEDGDADNPPDREGRGFFR